MEQLQGKAAFVTGGASGIGLGIVEAFLEAGMKVMIADLRQDHIDSALERLSAVAKDGDVAAIRLDVTDRDGFERAADEAFSRFGKVHVLVNNAGVGIAGPIATATHADWDWGLGVNLGGAVNGLCTFLPRMIAQGEGGHIVMTSSQAGVSPAPRNAAIYATAKAALVGMSEGMREELADHGIGISVLLAGFFRTNIHEAEQNRPDRFKGASGWTETAPAVPPPTSSPASAIGARLWRESIEAGRQVVDAIRHNDLYIATHGELKGWTEGRFEEILAAYPPARDTELLQAMGRRRPVNPFGD